MTRTIRKHVLAECDLVDIWQYSYEQWGADRADRYLDELSDGIQRLAESPEIGVDRGFVREGCRVLFINRHAVYYTVTPSTIHIIRVLHGQMDPGANL